jgi:hypothetical protein
VHVPHSFGHPQPNGNSVAVSHARRSRNTVPIADTAADGIRHRVAHGLRNTNANANIHTDTDTDTDCHGRIYDHSLTDTHADCDSDGLHIGRGTVISDT